MLWITAMIIGAVVPHWINSARVKIRNFAGARASLKLTPLDRMWGPWCSRAHRAADALTGGSNKNRDELLRRGTEIKLWGNVWDSSVILQSYYSEAQHCTVPAAGTWSRTGISDFHKTSGLRFGHRLESTVICNTKMWGFFILFYCTLVLINVFLIVFAFRHSAVFDADYDF